MNAPEATSTRPYLIRALYEWCTDNGLTPYVAVQVDEAVQVPREYVKNNEIVLNISFDATSSLKLGNDFIEFKARFAGMAREIIVPVDHVIAIYARENGQGMAFPSAPPVVSAGPLAFPSPASDGSPHAAGLTLAPVVADGKLHAPAPEISGGSQAPESPLEPPTPPRPTRPSLKRIK